MTVYLVISLPNIPYIHRIYMVLANTIYYAAFLLLPSFGGDESVHYRMTAKQVHSPYD